MVARAIRSAVAAALALVAAGASGEGAPQAGDRSGARAEASFRTQRQALARELQGRDIRDARVLDAMATVPRHRFVPEPLRDRAYEDLPLPIGRGQTISQPYVVAFTAQALELRGRDRVLEVGSGSGYAAVVLSRLASQVYGIELEEELHARSVATIRDLGYGNVNLRHGDGFRGWPEEAPFDAIVMSCATDAIPAALWDQLATGGRLVYPKGGGDVQELVIVTKTAHGARERRLALVSFVPMRRAR